MTKDPGFSRTPDRRERRAMFINDMLATARNLFPGNPHLSHVAPDKWLTTCLRPELRAVLETLKDHLTETHGFRPSLSEVIAAVLLKGLPEVVASTHLKK